MGTYSTQEFMDLFGGLPERGEAYVDFDMLRDAAREQANLDNLDALAEAFERQHEESAAEAHEQAMFDAEHNDIIEQERLQHEADLRHEYSGPEYHEMGDDYEDD